MLAGAEHNACIVKKLTSELALATVYTRLRLDIWLPRRACLNAHAVPAGVVTEAEVTNDMVARRILS